MDDYLNRMAALRQHGSAGHRMPDEKPNVPGETSGYQQPYGAQHLDGQAKRCSEPHRKAREEMLDRHGTKAMGDSLEMEEQFRTHKNQSDLEHAKHDAALKQLVNDAAAQARARKAIDNERARAMVESVDAGARLLFYVSGQIKIANDSGGDPNVVESFVSSWTRMTRSWVINQETSVMGQPFDASQFGGGAS